MGKPIIAWTIEAALKSNIFDRIVVSTDDEKIAEIAKEFGAEVPFMRNVANDDTTPVSEATIFAIKQAEKFWSEEYDIVVQLMANCPIRGSREIIDSFSYFIEKNNKSQISCFKFEFMNPWWATKIDIDGNPEFIFPESLKARSQDLPNLYCPTGAIWISNVKDLYKVKTFYSNDYVLYPISWKAAIDIDNYEDIEFAKAVFKLITSNNINKNAKKK